MNEQAIIALCDKLGTTADYLLPRAIEYGTHSAKYSLALFLGIFAIGVVFIFWAVLLDRKHEDLEALDVVVFSLGAIALIVAIVGVPISAYDMHMWKRAPEISAYRMLLSWLK